MPEYVPSGFAVQYHFRRLPLLPSRWRKGYFENAVPRLYTILAQWLTALAETPTKSTVVVTYHLGIYLSLSSLVNK